MSNPIIIGIDHGYAAMKTAHCSFPTGLLPYAHEPYSSDHVLEYDGQFYVIGSGRQDVYKRQAMGTTSTPAKLPIILSTAWTRFALSRTLRPWEVSITPPTPPKKPAVRPIGS